VTRETLPTVKGRLDNQSISILLINPNSTPSMTQGCLDSLLSTLPPLVTVTGFTAPQPSPSAIEGHFDAVLSAATCLRVLKPILSSYDAILVACFSAHPLINALREEANVPVIGIMEASLYAARMLGGRLGVVATGQRSVFMHQDAIRGYGFEGFSVGAEGTGLGVLDLERMERTGVENAMAAAAVRLVDRGADCVCLGCAGMTGMKDSCEKALEGRGALVLDGVGVGVQFLVGLVRERLTTGKRGLFRSSEEGRKARGQGWI